LEGDEQQSEFVYEQDVCMIGTL